MTDSLSELKALRNSLADGPQRLDRLWQERTMLWQTLGWTQAQLRLWLRSLPGMRVEQGDSDNPGYALAADETAPANGADLGELIAKVVDAIGRPLPLGQLRTRLPPGTVATEAMMRVAIQSHPKLTMTGPLVRWVK